MQLFVTSKLIGGWGCKAEGSPTGNPSPAPGTRTARTTRQINGASNFGSWGETRRFVLLSSGDRKTRPEFKSSSKHLLVDLSKGKQWFSSGHGFFMLKAHYKNKGFVNFIIESPSKYAICLTKY